MGKSGKINLPLSKLPFMSKSESSEESAETGTNDDDKDDDTEAESKQDTQTQETPDTAAANQRSAPQMGDPAAQEGIPTWIWILGIGVVLLFLMMGCVFIFMLSGDDDESDVERDIE